MPVKGSGSPISWVRKSRVQRPRQLEPDGSTPGLDGELETQERAALALELDELSQQGQRALLGAVAQADSLGQLAGLLPTSRQIGEEAGSTLCQVGLAQRAGDGK
jgi:hypothetical protein